MSLLETLAAQNETLKGLGAKIQWGTGRCPSCDSSRAEGHTKLCELARILEGDPHKSLGHLRGRPTTLPGVWGQMARAVGGVGKLAEEFQVTPKTLQRWAYGERRPSKNDVALIRAMVSVHRLRMPILKERPFILKSPSKEEK